MLDCSFAIGSFARQLAMDTPRQMAVMLLLLGVFFAIDVIRTHRNGMVEDRDEDDESKSRTYLREETPKRYFLHLGLGVLGALGCLVAGIYGWNHDLGALVDRIGDGLTAWGRR